MNRCIFVATSLFTALVSPASFAQEINIGEPVWIPMTTASESRVATALELEATLYKPEGLGILHDRYYSTEAIKPTFKGVWYGAANFGVLRVPSTR
jgi:hypothetical protein